MWYKETGLNPLVIGWAQEKGGQKVGKMNKNFEKCRNIKDFTIKSCCEAIDE